jgi:hypothetical protein
MIEPPLGALLMALARSTPLLGPYEHGTRTRTVPPAPGTPPADHEMAATPRALSLDADLDHRRPTPKSWMPREPRRYCAHHCCAFRRMLSQHLKARRRELRAFVLLSQALVTRRAPRRRIFGGARVPATPLKVGPDQAGGDSYALASAGVGDFSFNVLGVEALFQW